MVIIQQGITGTKFFQAEMEELFKKAESDPSAKVRQNFQQVQKDFYSFLEERKDRKIIERRISRKPMNDISKLYNAGDGPQRKQSKIKVVADY